MDPVTTSYYAAVCALLSYATGQVRQNWVRALIGAAVGVVAALLLPVLRRVLGL